ncbi:MAG: hypothetical protein ORN50_02585, partial [Crocinitomicaceae bacterium]|nr:hypothetical protein [Crocinitomicaceae bacterium]
IDSLKKANIQKCIQWCEKYKIPCNKFTEKINIFLNSVGVSEEIIGEESTLLYSENDDSPIYR